jgi:SAM-dependent methyltransferase
MRRHFPKLEVHYLAADFSKQFDFPILDGILMANALHFIKEKELFILKIREYLKPKGQLLIVEYNTDKGNNWVPYPISFTSWEKLAKKCGFKKTRLLNTTPSRYHKEVFSAVSYL